MNQSHSTGASASHTRAWRLKSRPTGLPTLENFEMQPLELPPLEEGMVRVENSWLSVDSYMRERMNDAKSYIPAFEIGAPISKAGRLARSSSRARPGTRSATP